MGFIKNHFCHICSITRQGGAGRHTEYPLFDVQLRGGNEWMATSGREGHRSCSRLGTFVVAVVPEIWYDTDRQHELGSKSCMT